MMEWYYATFFLLGSVLGLMLLGMPVAIAFIGANIAGAIYFMGGYGDFLSQASRGIGQLLNNAFPSLTTFNLIPVPMFLLMGELFFHGGLANRMFGAVEEGERRGGSFAKELGAIVVRLIFAAS